MSTTFYKTQGAGNDFVVFVDFTELTPQNVSQLCDRHKGIGADGVVNLYQISEALFGWDFFNSDGSRAEMCGNAARCVVRLVEKIFGYDEMELKTAAGIVKGRVVGAQVQIELSLEKTSPQKIETPFHGKYPVGYLINSGVPHFVIPIAHPYALKKEEAELAPLIHAPIFGEPGANLTFANLQKHPIETVTLERGVEAFTLACGTGVLATALVAQHLSLNQKNIQLCTPGGSFRVILNDNRAVLEGPAEIVYKGEI
ncbi:MAG: diaminopimelate epimerase [Bdellovibrionaceae bacterium]|nr:diaminopimelate epimerase [Pseudobdellovibrionaceae bacterium]